jgi:hypothetical protein
MSRHVIPRFQPLAAAPHLPQALTPHRTQPFVPDQSNKEKVTTIQDVPNTKCKLEITAT